MDTAVDNYEYDVEKATAHLLALQQPMAGDLRLITSSYKIAIDLERMSDFAVNIAELVKKMKDEHSIPLTEITTIASITHNMLTNSVKAYADSRRTNLQKLPLQRMRKWISYSTPTWEKMVNMMIDDAIVIPNAVDLIFVLRYLERIADHACNICESVVYMVTNQRPNLN